MTGMAAELHELVYGDDQDRHRRLLDQIRGLADWVTANAGEHDEAQSQLEDAEWCRTAFESVDQVLELLASYDPSHDSSDRAVYCVAQAVQSLHAVVAPLRTVTTYQERRAALAHLRSQLRHD